MKPCRHSSPKPGCRLCWLFEHDARYRQLWGGDPATATPAVAQAPTMPALTDEQRVKIERIKLVVRTPCRHRGEALETTSGCGCGRSSLRHECGIFGACRVYAPRAQDIETVAQCATCERYEAANG